MSTKIRPEISKKKRFYISKHRFYELKYFCRQYSEWKTSAETILDHSSEMVFDPVKVRSSDLSDPVFKMVEKREEYLDRMFMIEKAAKAASPDLWKYLMKGVTDGISYEHLLARYEIPCCKDTYYEAFRRFFWALSKLRK